MDRVPCYNHGTCNEASVWSETCQCSQENGIAKYHGESCEMPGSDACAGNPCQNGGLCTTIIQGETQACFINYIKTFYKSKVMLKL